MQNFPKLDRLLEYKNPQVIRRYQRDFPGNRDQTEGLLTELIKYLWLCKKHALDRRNSPNDKSLKFICMMHTEMREMDDMWHTFILHTKDYADFCAKYFGEFVHHVPSIVEEQPHIFGDFEEELTKYLSYVYDNLGNETVCKWFAEHLKEDESGISPEN